MGAEVQILRGKAEHNRGFIYSEPKGGKITIYSGCVCAKLWIVFTGNSIYKSFQVDPNSDIRTSLLKRNNRKGKKVVCGVPWSHSKPPQPSWQLHCHGNWQVPCLQAGYFLHSSQNVPCQPSLHLKTNWQNEYFWITLFWIISKFLWQQECKLFRNFFWKNLSCFKHASYWLWLIKCKHPCVIALLGIYWHEPKEFREQFCNISSRSITATSH